MVWEVTQKTRVVWRVPLMVERAWVVAWADGHAPSGECRGPESDMRTKQRQGQAPPLDNPPSRSPRADLRLHL